MRHSTLPVSVLAFLAGCALPPPEEDVALGVEVAASIEADVGRYQDRELAAYVESVARRVQSAVEDSPFEYEFGILDQPEPNAFAAPGGFVYISRGLLALAQSEDELAGVLGHEMSHVELRHTAQQMRRRIIPGLLTLPGRVVGAIAPNVGGLVNAPLDGITALTQARYSRGHESEADRSGQDLAAAAGYEPAALGDILARMERVVALIVGHELRPTFFDSHPPTPTRVQETQDYAAQIERAPRSSESRSKDDFVRVLDGLVWGENPAHGEFRDSTFLHADLDLAIAFPESWRPFNTASAAGATSSDESAIAIFRLEPMQDLDALVETSSRELRAEGFTSAGDSTVRNGGIEIRILESVNPGQSLRLVQGWIRLGPVLGSIVAIGPSEAGDALRATVKSLRALTSDERESIMVTRVRVVAARAGERLPELRARTSASGSLPLTAALNGLEEGAVLEDGQLVKVLRSEAYAATR